MKSAILILCFIIFETGLFLINDFWLLGLALILEVGILVVWPYMNWRTMFKFFIKNCSFMVFVILCNVCFTGWYQALLIGFRLGLAIGATYIFSRLLGAREFARGIAILCMPLKVFRVDTTEVALSITVALTFIPLIAYEAKQLQNSLKLKGCNWRTILRRPQVYVIGMMEQLFTYIEVAEQSLRLKGYE